MKRFLSMGLSILLIFLMLPFTALAATLPFDDVKQSDWFYKDVLESYESGVLTGVSDTKFSPGSAMTRAMFVTALAKHSTNYNIVDVPQKFTDVKKDSWYYDAVQWAAELRIVGGHGGNFSPNSPLTRADAVTIMYRYCLLSTGDFTYLADYGETAFTDFSSVPSYAVEAMEWSIFNEVINGVSPTKLSPKSKITRAQSAAILNRLVSARTPILTTYTNSILWGSSPALTLELPSSWQSGAIITTEENTEGSALKVSFYSRRNQSNNIEGFLFSLDFVTAKPTGNAEYITDYLHNGTKYMLYASFPSEAPDGTEMETYLRMSSQIDNVLSSIRMGGIDTSISVIGSKITMMLPNEWKDKYLVSYGTSTPSIYIYEKLNYESPSDEDGLVFGIVLLKSSEPIMFPNYDKLADMQISGINYTLCAYYPSDVRFDSTNPNLQNAYMALYDNRSAAINNVYLDDSVIIC